ncbi:DNA polymerase III subunit alpha [Erysipelothrix sp. HDW6A]|uniref:DNA polymerase III subunit alpha n=1 Tax=Erysipelothrix sp. HDW6A TaxID=2714928 RepID=UPI001407C518|nr:DNA polymerase III subunit alpha [Erysipelothrix sp. HDW6A]QIK57476.1 DNA polymerase III subunit alpha [Erysipelothrix sp. HDW6A]
MIHLHVRSSYSLLRGLMDVNTIVRLAKEHDMSAIALTDYHVLFGALNFQKACEKAGVKPIFGIEVTIEDYTSTLIAKNNRGYQGLMTLSYKLSKDGKISLEDITPYRNDVIFIAHSENGPFEASLLSQDNEAVVSVLMDLKEKFPHLFVGLSHQESSFFRESNRVLERLSESLDIDVVAFSKVYYEKPEDEETYRVVQAIDKGTFIDDKTLVSAPNRNFYSPEIMSERYSEVQIKNTKVIADMCNVDVFAITTRLPRFDTGQEADNAVFLTKLSEFGLSRRLKNQVTETYRKRLAYELSIINGMSFTDYFLIVYDVIRYGKKEGIYVGPGRGSAAGSLVAYSLGITEVDPLEYGLLFERFLNPERISMPDIDIDFPDNKRQDVIDYMISKYGHDHVAHIVTFGTLKARQAFRDVGRVFQIPVRKVDTITKLISADTLQENYDNVPKFRTSINADRSLQQVFEVSKSVEGLMRHTSLHAAGIVLSSVPLLDVVPLLSMPDAMDVSQYDMTHLEEIGLVKIDFLGLRNLTIIDSIVRDINKHKKFSIMDIPLNDAAAYSLISQGDTIGIFQLESDGMKNLLRKMKPRQFTDIVDAIALYRPGPMENIPLYLESRNNPDKVTYLHPNLKEITESTYGVLIYQEQIMQVAQVMAGFSLARADILRKAMGKKDAKELGSMKQEFIEGCIANQHSSELAEALFALIEKFANYGFNKSHSVAYGLISYQMAYLKANYSLLFYAYLLTSVISSDSKTNQYIDECRRRNHIVLGPHLSQSTNIYAIEDNKLRVPLTLVKGVSKNIAQVIIEERKQNGHYQSYYDAISRLNLVGIKRSHFELLIKAGAFDFFGYNRPSMIQSLDEALQYAGIIKVEKADQRYLNFDLVSEPLFTEVADNLRQDLSDEYDVLGIYFSQHPAVSLKQKHNTDSVATIQKRDEPYRVIAMIDRVKTHRAKNGQMMAFIACSDDTGSIEAVVFSNVYEKAKDILAVGNLVLIKGNYRKEGSFIVNDMLKFES